MGAQDKVKRALVVGSQLVLLAVAALCFYYGGNNFVIHGFGILAIFAGLAIVRKSRSLPAAPKTLQITNPLALRPWHWLVGIALLIAVVAAYIWLQRDAMTGGQSVAPVYAFAATALLCGAWWSGLFARWLKQ